MAKMQWFSIDADLETHPKFIRFRTASSLPSGEAVLALHRLWAFTRKKHPEGLLPGHSRETIGQIIGIPAATKALFEVGFCSAHDDGVVVVSFAEHHRKLLKDKERVQEYRERTRNVRERSGDTVTYTSTEKKKNPPTPRRSRSLAEPPGFDEFYKTYPRRVGRPSAARAYRTALKGGVDPSLLLSAAKRFSESRPDPQFTPYPATWLNDRRWEDQPVLSVVNGTSEDTIMAEIHRRVAELEGRA